MKKNSLPIFLIVILIFRFDKCPTAIYSFLLRMYGRTIIIIDKIRRSYYSFLFGLKASLIENKNTYHNNIIFFVCLSLNGKEIFYDKLSRKKTLLYGPPFFFDVFIRPFLQRVSMRIIPFAPILYIYLQFYLIEYAWCIQHVRMEPFQDFF